MAEVNKYAELAQRIAKAKRGWFPNVGQVVNITFDEFEAMLVLQALHEASLPTMAKTLQHRADTGSVT